MHPISKHLPSPLLRALAALLTMTGAAGGAWAQGALQGNPADALPQLERPGSAAQQPAVNPVVPTVTPEQMAIQARLAQPVVPQNFDVHGVKAIDFEQVQAILEPLAGKQTTVGELAQEVNKITELYRAAGYPLSFALLQQQSFANGLVVVTVVEGHIGSLRIDGDPGGAESRLRALSQPLIDEKPLTQATLERQLNLMRMVPGASFTPTLDLPQRADGASELALLQVSHKPVSLNGGIADLGTGNQGLVNLATNSLTPLGEQVKLTAALPLQSDDVRYFAGEVRVPIGTSGLAAKIDGYTYRAEPEVLQPGFDDLDRTVRNERLGIGLSYPILLSNEHSLTATGGVYATQSRDRYTDRAGSWFEQDVRVRAATAQLQYVQVTPAQSRDITLGVSRGFDAAGASKELNTNFGVSGTPEVDLDFTRFNLEARQNVRLPAQFELRAAAAGQYSNDILPNSEQTSFGSWRFAMGYPQGEQSGDKGLGVSLELNRRFNLGFRYLAALQPYVLADYARTWYNAAHLRQFNDRQLTSAALGLRVTDDRYYMFDVNVAKPMGERTVVGNDRDWRFNANYSLFYDAF